MPHTTAPCTRFIVTTVAGALLVALATVPVARGAETPATAPASATAAATPAPPSGPWRGAVDRFAREHFHHPAWGYSHSLRDYALARELAAADGVTLDDDVLYAAALLHDVAAFAPWADPKADHADRAADLVPALLAGTDFPQSKLGALQGAIRTHMYDRDPRGPEAIYLHDADSLDWLGAIGAARVFGAIDPQGEIPDGPAAAAFLESLLASVPARILSPAGRARLPGLQAELERFLGELKRETDGLKTL